MKIEARHVRFLRPALWPTRRRVVFVGTENTIQPFETGVVIEGQRQRLFLPFVDWLFSKLLSERSTVTIPYGRIADIRVADLLGWRVILTILVWLLSLLTAVLWARFGDGSEVVVMIGIWALVAGMLTGVINLYWLLPRIDLRFRQADGNLALIRFRIRSQAKRSAFLDLLERYGIEVDDPTRERDGRSSRLSARGMLSCVQALRKAKAQWGRIWTELNPSAEWQVQQLLHELQGPHLFSPDTVLQIIERACHLVLSSSAEADGLTVLRAAARSVNLPLSGRGFPS